MLFPGWRVELQGTWKSALRRISYSWLCQPHLAVKISDAGEIHSLYRQSTSSASSFFIARQKCLFNFHFLTKFLPHSLVTGRIHYFFWETYYVVWGWLSESDSSKDQLLKRCVFFWKSFMNWFPLIIIAYEVKQSLFAFLSC